MTCGIYKITEKETGRHYIGQSKNIEGRWKAHHKRFPPEFFTYQIVATCLPEAEVLDALERFCIGDFNAKLLGFNLTRGGNGAWGWKNPEETRAKISASNKGKIISKERAANISAGRKRGKKVEKLSEEHRANISASNKGRKRSEKTRAKMSFPKQKVTCPHCGKIGGTGAMGQWHFNNCKEKK
jgi:hypothetical protein